jgi:hypothetical protein
VLITHHKNIPNSIPSHTQPEKMGMSQYERHEIPNIVAAVEKRGGCEFLDYAGNFGKEQLADVQLRRVSEDSQKEK